MDRFFGIVAVQVAFVVFATIGYGQETVDQVNNPPWKGGATNIIPANKVSQVFVPSLPCLTGLEVGLKTGNRGRGGDQVTLKVLGGNGQLIGSSTAAVPEGFDGFWRFSLPGGGVSVTPRQPVTLQLQDTGKTIFWWKYANGNPYAAGSAYFNGAPFADNDFMFKSYGGNSCGVVSPNTPPKLNGYVDLHTHPMSYLGFGRKAIHGAPDVNAIIPAGTRGCNPVEMRSTSIIDALGNCNATHGGWGLDNTCGDYIRAAIINLAMDSKFRYKTANLHGDHEHQGSPDFRFWPHQTSTLHQQMWWEWVKRARDGGLRVIVALTVNSELLAEILNGQPPYDDRTVADLQIDETIRYVNNHRDFMEIAYSAADVRRIVAQNKLAVVLGMEVDKLGNFGKPGVITNNATVRAEIQRLYRKGIRYAFPVHLINNSFGGAAVYDMMFSFANKRANGTHFMVTKSPDPLVTYNAAELKGFENVAISAVRGLLDGIGQLPAPCFNDLIKCSPPPGKVQCCGSYQSILNAMTPTREVEIYKVIPPGHVNVLGLTPLGEVAINEMMKLGMMIDVDHMSELAMTKTIDIAEKVPGITYPLVMGHNGVRVKSVDAVSERSAPLALIRRVARLGGMVGANKTDILSQ